MEISEAGAPCGKSGSQLYALVRRSLHLPKRVRDGTLRWETFQLRMQPLRAEVEFLGVGNRPAFMHDPQTNGVIERFSRTIKEECIGLHDFRNAQDAREVMGEWIDLYNEEWILERHRYRSPREVRREIDAKGKEPVAT